MSGKEKLRRFNLCLLGLGNVNRTLVRLLQERERELGERYGIGWRITGIATRRLGWVASPSGLDSMLIAESLSAGWNQLSHVSPPLGEVREWLKAAHADVLFEATSLNSHSGQPAIDHIRAALEAGAHAITANKGPIVYAYDELRTLAAKKHRRFLFESTVMDGVPIFSFFDHGLPAIRVKGFRGILNSTTNVILSGMEEGLSFQESLKRAQDVGVAEADPTDDIDGWDAAVKIAALVRVLMEFPIALKDIEREGIGHLSSEMVSSAKHAGRPYRLVCQARRKNGGVTASVRPEQIPLSDPLAHVVGTSSVVHFETDIFPGLAIVEHNPGLQATAYGMLSDFIRAVTAR